MRADRLVVLLLLLQTRGRMTAQELAERLEVSERTVYRDMMALGIAGVPVYAERGPGGGCRLAEGYRTNLTGLTEAEVRTLFLTGTPRLLRDLGLGRTLEDALLKLLAALPSAHRRDAERARQRIYVDAAGWARTEEAVPHLRVIEDALWQDRKVHLTYRKANGELTERVVDPLGLVAKASVWYLVADGATGLRVFRVSRVQAAHALEEASARPEGFDLVSFWEAWSVEFEASWRRYPVTVRVAPQLYSLLGHLYGERFAPIRERASAPDAQGWLTIELTFDCLEDARTHILGYGAWAEVLAPVELRASVIEFAAEVAAFYAAHQVAVPAGAPGLGRSP